MSITSLDGYIASAKQWILYTKIATRTTVGAYPFSLFDLAGNPGAGTLDAGNTANGTVPTSSIAGYPLMKSISNTGYLSTVNFGGYVASTMQVYDRLFVAGGYNFNADTTLTAQPSYSGRVPGLNYNGLELWVECVTGFTGTPSFQVNYLNQSGNAGDTGVFAAPAALTVGRCVQLPFATGDSGIQQITRVRGTVASGGTFNVMVLRPLWANRIAVANGGGVDDMLKTGLKQIYATTAFYVLISADSTSSGYPYLKLEVCDG